MPVTDHHRLNAQGRRAQLIRSYTLKRHDRLVRVVERRNPEWYDCVPLVGPKIELFEDARGEG